MVEEEVEDVHAEGQSLEGSDQLDNVPITRSAQEERYEECRNLPPSTRRRLAALKQLLKERLAEDAKCDKEIHRMVCAMHDRMEPLYSKADEIVSGAYTPSQNDLYTAQDQEPQLVPVDPPGFVDEGIPHFWLTVLKSSNVTSSLVQPYDEPILRFLRDVRVVWRPEEPIGFTLQFFFKQNPYFSNEMLTKAYDIRFQEEGDDPLMYDGPEIARSEGCSIDWFEGKNVTLKTVKKKQKHRRGALTRIVTRRYRIPSFFNFFATTDSRNEADKQEEETEDEFEPEMDFEIGQFMKDKLIPQAVMYFSGEVEDELTSDSDLDDSEEISDISGHEIIDTN